MIIITSGAPKYTCFNGKLPLLRDISQGYWCPIVYRIKRVDSEKSVRIYSEEQLMQICNSNTNCTGYDFYENNKNEAYGHLCTLKKYPGIHTIQGGYKLCYKEQGW